MAELEVEVVHALPERQERVTLRLSEGAKVGDAVAASGFTDRSQMPRRWAVGRYGAIVALDAPLRDGDRIEIYRPLAADPKEARRLRTRRKR